MVGYETVARAGVPAGENQVEVLRLEAQACVDLFPAALWVGKGAERLQTGLGVALRQGRIVAVAPPERLPPGATRRIELPGLTLLPGLVDAHVHLALDGRDFAAAVQRWSQPTEAARQIERNLRDTLLSGIVAVRDGGDRNGYGLLARGWVTSGRFAGPRVVATGPAVTRKGYYGSFLGGGAADVTEACRQIEAAAARGADQIKLVLSGLVSFHAFSKVGPLHFSSAEIRQLVSVAHGLGRRVMAHVNSAQGVKGAVEAGVESVEHGYFLDIVCLKMMADSGTVWVPTVAAVANRAKSAKTPDEVHVITRTYRSQLERVGQAWQQGVVLAVGTDAGAAGVFHGATYFEELELFRLAGLANHTILTAATYGGARALGLEAEIGTIEAGKMPYFLAVNGNPLRDLNVLRKPNLIITPAND